MSAPPPLSGRDGVSTSYAAAPNDNGEAAVFGWNNRIVLTGIRMVREEWAKVVTEAERLIADAQAETAAA
ncbi:hypothetical protein [Paraburkholderia aromaticivorans]|uniref:hypothetical protein n=1 Tax=Paraburkholderia aromaticivorans TaxID=2026199 RepID=UPI0014562141|nr:hypothetical protein [Paraburkholderia aromaticivorans]